MSEQMDWSSLGFGYHKTDYNVRCYFRDGKWGEIETCSEETIPLHMAATCLHYGQEAFEGLKAYRCPDGKVRVFRMNENAARLQSTCRGILMPEVPTELFEEMVESARKWVKYLKENEHPDIIIGLFHSGLKGGIVTDKYKEDATLEIAETVPGFDIILYGHDHIRHCQTVTNTEGKQVLLLDPTSNAYYVGDAQITVTIKKGKVIDKRITGEIHDIRGLEIDKQFEKHFQYAVDSVNNFVNRKIGTFKNAIYTRDCYFGSSAFCDFIHSLQLRITGADISFNGIHERHV